MSNEAMVKAVSTFDKLRDTLEESLVIQSDTLNTLRNLESTLLGDVPCEVKGDIKESCDPNGRLEEFQWSLNTLGRRMNEINTRVCELTTLF